MNYSFSESLASAGAATADSLADTTADYIVQVDRSDRWLVYHRLQELGIDCQCSADGRLSARLASAHDAIQIWSVVQQLTQPRRWQLDWLERCWCTD